MLLHEDGRRAQVIAPGERVFRITVTERDGWQFRFDVIARTAYGALGATHRYATHATDGHDPTKWAHILIEEKFHGDTA